MARVIDAAGVGECAYDHRMTEQVLKATLSPSRIMDFESCALKFRYRTVERFPERPGAEALRGTVVHQVLEDLFLQPAASRTLEFAIADLSRAFELVVAKQPTARFALDPDLVWPADERPAAPEAVEAFRAALPEFLRRYFDIEYPEKLEPAHRELYLKQRIDDDLWLHGFVDRIDIAPTGQVRIVDYKTGKAPGPRFADAKLLQLKIYALLWERLNDQPVDRLLMLFLGDGQRLEHVVRRDDLQRVEDRVIGIWADIKRANELAEWRPRPSKLCDWCTFHVHCPAQGGTTPVFTPLPIIPDQT